jgi:hypothetical protein
MVSLARTTAPFLTCHTPSESRETNSGWSLSSAVYCLSTLKPRCLASISSDSGA